MVASAQSPADLANLALVRIGFKLRVGSLFDGSDHAKIILDIYAQTRDEILRQDDWEFAERNVVMTLLKSSPVGGYIPPNTWNPATNPPIPWLYEYAYPSDCLKIRAVKAIPLFLPNFQPLPNVYSVINDNALNPPARAIVCNVPNAALVYTGQVTDPTSWEADFVEAFAAILGRRLAPRLAPQMLQAEAADEATSTAIAERERG